jgi:nitrite reductase/ring-hydroxylating ferredoxin subunit
VRNGLHGTWLGHPVHPVLTDIPVGAWTAALVLDLADASSGRDRRAGAACTCIAVGLAGASAAAVTGATDWQYTHDNARRMGLVHGTLNLAATGLYAGSWRARRHGRTGRGRALSAVGYLIAASSAYLGGSMVSRHRIGTDHSDHSLEPRQFTPVLADVDLPDGQLRGVKVEDTSVVLVRSGARVHAFPERCPHLGGPLSEGWLYRDSIVCPWHGSRFALDGGRVTAGPATAPLECLHVRVRDGQIEVCRRPRVPAAAPGSVVAREQRDADAGN